FYALAVMFGFAYGGVMPLYAILVREDFGARVMGNAFGGVALASTLGRAGGSTTLSAASPGFSSHPLALGSGRRPSPPPSARRARCPRASRAPAWLTERGKDAPSCATCCSGSETTGRGERCPRKKGRPPTGRPSTTART